MRLTEYSRFKDMEFEIQIRTILQHAWAQIEHGWNYKLSDGLSGKIRRRLYLLQAGLEIFEMNPTDFGRKKGTFPRIVCSD
jgi:putative GTP pyrophosphokinase